MAKKRNCSVHPRLRGELCQCSEREQKKNGSSPLTRGTHCYGRYLLLQRRFIPAYAGNSQGRSSICSTVIRFIPAYAGNSRQTKKPSFVRAVHPRLRGELSQTLHPPSVALRFIPAYAGNSSCNNSRRLALSVHPRLRGELAPESITKRAIYGSSPLTRGTHLKTV